MVIHDSWKKRVDNEHAINMLKQMIVDAYHEWGELRNVEHYESGNMRTMLAALHECIITHRMITPQMETAINIMITNRKRLLGDDQA
jgi:hypothetical protein